MVTLKNWHLELVPFSSHFLWISVQQTPVENGNLELEVLSSSFVLFFDCNLSFSRFVAKLWNEIHCHIRHLPMNKFKKTLHSEHLSPRYSYVTLVSGYLFDSCQSTITRMSIRMTTIKLNTDCICLGHLASNALSLQENLAHLAANQSERAIVAMHIIIVLYCFFVLDESLKFVIASFWAGQSFALLLCCKKL